MIIIFERGLILALNEHASRTYSKVEVTDKVEFYPRTAVYDIFLVTKPFFPVLIQIYSINITHREPR